MAENVKSQGMHHVIAKAGKSGCVMWLPLWMHAKDTAGVIEWLLDNWLADSVCQALQESGKDKRLSKKELRQLMRFLGYIHDIGKVTPYFQSLISKNIPECREVLKDDGYLIPDWDRYEKSGSNHAYISEILLKQCGCPEGVASIVGSHHGMTQEMESSDIKRVLNKNGILAINLYGERNANENSWESLRNEFLQWALKESGYESVSEIPRLLQKGEILLTGLLIMADWIASNEGYFPLLLLSQESNESIYPTRIKYAMDELVKMPNPWRSECFYMDEHIFKGYFGFEPRKVQMHLIQIIQNIADSENQKPGIFILEAPMGVGKTEAALACAQILANRTSAGGLFFGLPTQATANSIFERLIPWEEKQTQENEKYAVRLAHGMADFNQSYQELFETEASVNMGEDEPEKNGLYAHIWFKGKKQAMLANFVAGTIDQLLISSLKKKHIMMQHLGMAGKIVIVDECHAYDVYMSKYLDRTLSWLGAYGQSVIILSATLPAKRRKELIAAYLNKEDELEKIPSVIEKSMSYPVLTYSVGEEVFQEELDTDTESKIISVESVERSDIAKFLQRELNDGGCAAIILNTVKRVQEAAAYLKEALPDKDILELHSRYIYPDRKVKEEELLNRMGKSSTEKERNGLILVASQVAEQSLDFDTDILITELCPMDLLLQRMGREHRHKTHDKIRPENLSKPRCIIIKDDGQSYDQASKSVYDESILMKTQAILPKQIDIPNDIPKLVQTVYADGNDWSHIEGYVEAEKKHRKKLEEQEQKASVYLLSKPPKHEKTSRREKKLDSFLKNSTQVNDKQAEATVRDVKPSLEVLVLQKVNGKVRFLPWEDKGEILDGGQLPAADVCKKIASQRLRLPSSLCRRDRLGSVITELEQRFEKDFFVWKQSPWINGELLLILDEDLSDVLCGVKLSYSRQDGLTDMEEKSHE